MIKIDTDNCNKCKQCETSCPAMAIHINANIVDESCIQCLHCVAICQQNAIAFNGEYGAGLVESTIQAQNFELLMQKRRSYRRFKKDAVPKELIQHFFDHLKYSPTASNSQKLEFTVVTQAQMLQYINDQTIVTLSKAFNRMVNGFTIPLLKLFMGKKSKKLILMKEGFIQKAATRPHMITYQAPALIIVHTAKQLTGMPNNDANIWIGMAVLYAETLGLGTCINGFIVSALKRNKKMKANLGVPFHHEVHSALLLGYPDERFINGVSRDKPKIAFVE